MMRKKYLLFVPNSDVEDELTEISEPSKIFI